MAREDRLTPQQRLDAIGEIFARGVHRYLVKQEVEAATKPRATEDDEDDQATQPQ